MRGTRAVIAAVALAGLAAGATAARAQPDDGAAPDVTEPVDPYARDPAAPVPPPDRARGWAIRPRPRQREAVEWIKDTTKHGVKFTLQMVLTPVDEVLSLNNRFELVRRVESWFYNVERTAGVLPSAEFVTRFGSSVGASLFHKDLFGQRERATLKVSYGGVFDQSYQLALDFPHMGGDRVYARSLVRFEEASVLFFRGLGHPPAPDDPTAGPFDPREADVESGYRQTRVLSVASAGVHLGRRRRLSIGGSAIYNRREFAGVDAGDLDDGELPIEDAYDTAAIAAFDDGEDTLELTLDVTFDSRDLTGKTGRGVLIDLFAGGAPSLDGNPYLHYGVEASLFLTLFRRGRVLMFRSMLEGVEGGEERIPFTELPRLGGPNRLRGYRLGRFRDNLAAVGTLEYRYPIHYLASGLFFGEVGKVARTYRGLSSTENWQPALGGGIVIHTLEDVKLRLDLSYGEGFEIFVSTDALAAFADRRREL